jgi:hypothetical protein
LELHGGGGVEKRRRKRVNCVFLISQSLTRAISIPPYLVPTSLVPRMKGRRRGVGLRVSPGRRVRRRRRKRRPVMRKMLSRS